MPKAERYAIIDEPAPGRFAQLAVSPTFPMFAFMLGGAWIGWLWFAINGYAFGSAARGKELLVAALSPLLALGLFFALAWAVDGQLLSERAAPYAGLVIVLAKMASMYWLFNSQVRSFALYEYFGGQKRNGVGVLFVAAAFGRQLLADVPSWLRVVLQ
jgi:hypothetical protein